MILAIDVGNTNIVIGSMDGDTVNFMERVSTDSGKTEMEYISILKSVLDVYEIRSDDISGIIISSVVPPITQIMASAMKKLTKKIPLIVGPGMKTGLNIRTDDPSEVGADLIVDAVGALKDYPAPLILIDMGTATTISVIDEKRSFVGGCIMPGARISIDALTSRTAQLPKIDIKAPKKVVCSNTIECMQSGLVYSQAAALDGMIERIEDELGYEATVIATGGLSGSIVPHCRKKIIYDDELTLKGLSALYEKNR